MQVLYSTRLVSKWRGVSIRAHRSQSEEWCLRMVSIRLLSLGTRLQEETHQEDALQTIHDGILSLRAGMRERAHKVLGSTQGSFANQADRQNLIQITNFADDLGGPCQLDKQRQMYRYHIAGCDVRLCRTANGNWSLGTQRTPDVPWVYPALLVHVKSYLFGSFPSTNRGRLYTTFMAMLRHAASQSNFGISFITVRKGKNHKKISVQHDRLDSLILR